MLAIPLMYYIVRKLENRIGNRVQQITVEDQEKLDVRNYISL